MVKEQSKMKMAGAVFWAAALERGRLAGALLRPSFTCCSQKAEWLHCRLLPLSLQLEHAPSRPACPSAQRVKEGARGTSVGWQERRQHLPTHRALVMTRREPGVTDMDAQMSLVYSAVFSKSPKSMGRVREGWLGR